MVFEHADKLEAAQTGILELIIKATARPDFFAAGLAVSARELANAFSLLESSRR